jgi:biotin-[acetyl-CoA-carboxylase] ligase BirA-like protein
MKLFSLDSIPSTSTEAFRLLSENTPTPFAVLAKQQSSGRGQQSRTWESPKGNIYLSIACSIQKEKVSLIPLMTACTLVQWLNTKLSIHALIKWPNDLLLNRKKFAGILCEAFWEQNTTQTKVVIGIGINVSSAPVLENAGYGVECLKSYLLKNETAEALALSFLEFWKVKTYESTEHLLREFESCHLPLGEKWQDLENPGTFYNNIGFSKKGYLRLRDVSTGKILELVSAQHSLRWIS